MRHVIAGHAVNTTYTDVGSADFAGVNICHPCKIGSSILAADGPAIACRIINKLINTIAASAFLSTALSNDKCDLQYLNSWNYFTIGKVPGKL